MKIKTVNQILILLLSFPFFILQCYQLPFNKKEQKDNRLLAAVALRLSATRSSSTSGGSTNNTSSTSRSRQQVLDDYNANYLGSEVTNLGWTGSVSGCNAGSVSGDADAKVAQRVNFFRRQVGLPDQITIDSSVQSKVQEAALIMLANNTLTHSPTSGMTCYTTGGAEAAGKSNLGYGNHSSSTVTSYIQDAGSNNTGVGHRRWIRYSKLNKVEHGSTSSTNALWVIGYTAGSSTSLPEFVSWPPMGYVANALVFSRWSFSIPNQSANFSAANITMTNSSGGNISLTKETLANGYGDNTIVWVPTGINTASATDVTYRVNITGVTIGTSSKSYSYDVTLFNP